jgi:hypothetical protein
MFFAILAYHAEGIVESWSPQEDAALMKDLLAVHDRLVDDGRMGPAARLGPTAEAATLRGPAEGVLMDGPFAETKEQLLGFYVVECADLEAAAGIARELRGANPTAVYEIRPIQLYIPGAPLKS